jgi:hypothetical protein
MAIRVALTYLLDVRDPGHSGPKINVANTGIGVIQASQRGPRIIGYQSKIGHYSPLLLLYGESLGLRLACYNGATRNLRALPTTLTEDRAIAAAAMIGESSRPNVG